MSIEKIINGNQVAKFGRNLPTSYIDRVKVYENSIEVETSCYFVKPQNISSGTFSTYLSKIYTDTNLVHVLMPEGTVSYSAEASGPAGVVPSTPEYIKNIVENNEFHFDTTVKNDPSKIYDLIKFCYNASSWVPYPTEGYNYCNIGISGTHALAPYADSDTSRFAFLKHSKLVDASIDVDSDEDGHQNFDTLYDSTGTEVRRYRYLLTFDTTAVVSGFTEDAVYNSISELLSSPGFKLSIASFVTTLPVDVDTEIEEYFKDENYYLKQIYLRRISDVTYEQISHNGVVKSPQRQVYINAQTAEPYIEGDVLQSIDALYYGEDGITRTQIVETFKQLISDFKLNLRKVPQSSLGPTSLEGMGRIIGGYQINDISIDEELFEVFDNINYILSVHGTKIDLVPKLRHYERTFPNTSTTTQVGEFYERYQQAIYNTNNAVKRGTQVVKSININPIVKDLRTLTNLTLPDRFTDFTTRIPDENSQYLKLDRAFYCCYTDPNNVTFKKRNTKTTVEQIQDYFPHIPVSTLAGAESLSEDTIINIKNAFEAIVKQFFKYKRTGETSEYYGMPASTLSAYMRHLKNRTEQILGSDPTFPKENFKALLESHAAIANDDDGIYYQPTHDLWNPVMGTTFGAESDYRYIFSNTWLSERDFGDLDYLIGSDEYGNGTSFFTSHYEQVRKAIHTQLTALSSAADIEALFLTMRDRIPDGDIVGIFSTLLATATCWSIYEWYLQDSELQVVTTNNYLFGYWFFDFEKALKDKSVLSYVYDVGKIEALYGKQVTNDKFILTDTTVERYFHTPSAEDEEALVDTMSSTTKRKADILPDLIKIGSIVTTYDDSNKPASVRVNRDYTYLDDVVVYSTLTEPHLSTPMQMQHKVAQKDLTQYEAGVPIGTIGFDAVQNSSYEKTYCVIRNVHWPDYFGEIVGMAIDGETVVGNNMYDYRLMCFEHQEVAGEFTSDTARSVGDFPYSGLHYKVRIKDHTADIVYALVDTFVKYYQENWSEYYEAASEQCNYNSYDNKYSDYFVQSMKEIYDSNPVTSPWYIMSAMYHLHLDLLYDAYGGLQESILQASIETSEKINPEAGSYTELQAFHTTVGTLIDTFYKTGGTQNIYDRIKNNMPGTPSIFENLYNLTAYKPTLEFSNQEGGDDLFCGIPKPINLVNTLQVNKDLSAGAGITDLIQREIHDVVTRPSHLRDAVSEFSRLGADADNDMHGVKYEDAYDTGFLISAGTGLQTQAAMIEDDHGYQKQIAKAVCAYWLQLVNTYLESFADLSIATSNDIKSIKGLEPIIIENLASINTDSTWSFTDSEALDNPGLVKVGNFLIAVVDGMSEIVSDHLQAHDNFNLGALRSYRVDIARATLAYVNLLAELAKTTGPYMWTGENPSGWKLSDLLVSPYYTSYGSDSHTVGYVIDDRFSSLIVAQVDSGYMWYIHTEMGEGTIVRDDGTEPITGTTAAGTNPFGSPGGPGGDAGPSAGDLDFGGLGGGPDPTGGPGGGPGGDGGSFAGSTAGGGAGGGGGGAETFGES